MSETPQHVGYIVDGNRRWAKQRGLSAYDGHAAGYAALQDVLIATFEQGVSYVSAYVFSTENWQRSPKEVKHIMSLVLRMLTRDLDALADRNICLVVLGERDELTSTVRSAIRAAEEKTRANDGGMLALCFNYGGQQEIVHAIKQAINNTEMVDSLTAENLTQYMYAPEIPPCDLIVRTSGEMRLSNFMLWRAAYSELVFIEKNWPDMTKNDVTAILQTYASRKRRFGK